MTTVKLFAGTHVGLRDNNEDNFIICPNLDTNEWSISALHQTTFSLGNRGCLMVVADGMGGQNAGEVASEIAIHTVREMFASASLTANIASSDEGIKNYLKKVVIEADERIKIHSKAEVSTEGMGSTIVIAWCIDSKVYVAWLGDSRAYCIVPNKGIARLTKDHSYVQKLVDEGTLTDEEAMVHPNSNIITRSLGDTSQKAKPEVTEYAAEKGMVILLCSDGLCGVCTDAVIGGIVEDGLDDLSACCDKLTNAALNAGGSDNITIALLEFVEVELSAFSKTPSKKRTVLQKPVVYVGILIAALLMMLVIKLFWPNPPVPHPTPVVVEVDTPTTTKRVIPNVAPVVPTSKETTPANDEEAPSESSDTSESRDTILPSGTSIKELFDGGMVEPTKNNIAIPQDVTPTKK